MNTCRVGEAAEDLWKSLARKGPLALKTISKGTGLERVLAHMAVGWLAREGKAAFEWKGSDLQVALTEDEIKKHTT